jgi:ribosomal protein S18 acetylase RimI-like enzyme
MAGLAGRLGAKREKKRQMTSASIEVRSATAEERPHAVATIVAAFVTDPIARYALATPHDYLQEFPAQVRAFAGGSFAHGTADIAADFGGVALWLPPGVAPDGEALAQEFQRTAKAEHLADVLASFEQMDRTHPKQPHWYLPMIGVEPNAQGAGLGGALMRHAVARCDAQGALAYLESSNPRNIPLYQRHGFEAMGEIQVGAAPVVTPMIREPRPQRGAS